jgi:hypothetical protein
MPEFMGAEVAVSVYSSDQDAKEAATR